MRLRSLLIALLILPCANVAAQGPRSAARSSAGVDAAATDVPLVPSAYIFADPARTETLEDILGAPATQARRTRNHVASFGFSRAAYWFEVALVNTGRRPLERALVVEPTWLDDVQVTLVSLGERTRTIVGGDTHPFGWRALPYRQINFALTIPPGESRLVVRVMTRDPFYVGMTLLSRDAFYALHARDDAYFAAVYGALCALLLFNFVLFVAARDNLYLVYCVYLASFLVMHATYNGFTFPTFFAQAPELSNWAHSVSIYAYPACGVLFAITFLDLKRRHPVAHRLSRQFLMALGVTAFVTAVLGGYRANVIGSIVWIVIYSLFAIFLGVLSLGRKNNSATYYLSGSVAGLIGSATTAFTVMGLIPYSFMGFRAVDFGIVIDAILLSLALAERVSRATRLERLRRFFSPAVAAQLLAARSDELYRPHRREIVVVFLDLRGYTAFTLKYGADEVMRVLGQFHAAMGELISLHAATLERFAGDGMMIFLNDPVEIADPALKACRMALEMQESFARLNGRWEERGYSLSMGVGIAQGVATIGAIGFEGRRDYGAIGNVTNLAARLCSEASGGQIIVSSDVAMQVRGMLQTRPLRDLHLKGYADPVPCHELEDRAAQASREVVSGDLAGLAGPAGAPGI